MDAKVRLSFLHNCVHIDLKKDTEQLIETHMHTCVEVLSGWL